MVRYRCRLYEGLQQQKERPVQARPSLFIEKDLRSCILCFEFFYFFGQFPYRLTQTCGRTIQLALRAPALPTAKVPTGEPAGICTMEHRASMPPSADRFQEHPVPVRKYKLHKHQGALPPYRPLRSQRQNPLPGAFTIRSRTLSGGYDAPRPQSFRFRCQTS